jgi:DNA-binding CsgD family transcriptional regulator
MTKKKTKEAHPPPSAEALAVFDALCVPVLGIETGGTIVYANPAARSACDPPADHLPGAALDAAADWAGFWSEFQRKGFDASLPGHIVVVLDHATHTPHGAARPETAGPAELEDRSRRLFERIDALDAAIRIKADRRRQPAPRVPEELARLKQLVLPYVERLKQRRLTRDQRRFIELIEESIDPHLPRLSANDFLLSPNEARVAQLVKAGKTNQQIAKMMNLSKSTVLTHRHHVRVKLGLRNKKVNLRTFLSELNVA